VAGENQRKPRSAAPAGTAPRRPCAPPGRTECHTPLCLTTVSTEARHGQLVTILSFSNLNEPVVSTSRVDERDESAAFRSSPVCIVEVQPLQTGSCTELQFEDPHLQFLGPLTISTRRSLPPTVSLRLYASCSSTCSTRALKSAPSVRSQS
jgi:hypothetical protein